MAAPTIWKSKINDHAIFKELRNNEKKEDINIDCRNISIVQEGYLYVWDSHNCHILVSNLNAFSNIQPSDFSNLQNESNDQSHRNGTSFQKVMCMRPPVHDVHRLSFNANSGYLALIGLRGITVVCIPKTKSRFARIGDGGDKIICKSKTIGERLFFDCNLLILESMWHPATNYHIVMLTTDNHLRIFDLNQAHVAKLTYNLISFSDPKRNESAAQIIEDDRSVRNSGGLRLNTSAALGETAISFDILPPIVLSCKRAAVKETVTNSQIAWPMCILHGDGEVYYFVSTLPEQGDYSTYYAGPLHLSPGIAFSNDACCIRVLPNSVPPVLTIATTAGIIYHCLIISEQNGNKIDFNAVRCSSNYSANFYPPTSLNMYVYETVKLHLTLTESTSLYSCPITLRPDIVHCDRYYCLHMAGIHCVTIPWTNSLKQLCTGSGDNMIEMPATIEHILCLRPSESTTSTQTLFAFAQFYDSILCLTSERQCLVLNIPRHQKLPSLALMSRCEDADLSSSKLAYPNEDSFERRIASILKHTGDNPIISAGTSANYDERVCYDIIVRITRVFREQNIKRLGEARDEIIKKVRYLEEFKKLQMDDLQQCQNQRGELFDNAKNLSKKYEDACKRQKNINMRLEMIVTKIQNRLPRLSEAERFVKNEFITIETSIEKMEKKLNKIRLKKEYQIGHTSKEDNISISLIKEPQQKNIQNTLLRQGGELKDLVTVVNNLRNVLGQV